ncbi:hypothetical protein BN1708_002406 [Verticillium longisporum]|uniref:BZIP domain-containing protein n=1 Tax=Verticillium longisporum TaxID=100787 RepID=A0A0G4KQE9_VERLO|nr:hypothetical protein BN1708_002406 [Verticillium longisporum]
MSNTIFRIFNPGAPKEDPLQKRRGQVRRAQQAYRDRKDKYTKALEKQLAETRSSEARLTRECEDLRAALDRASGLLAQHGIQAPLELRQTGSSALDRTSPGQRVVEALSSPMLFSPASLAKHYLPSGHAAPATSVEDDGNRSTPGVAQGSPRVCECDQVTMAMEFVLKCVATLSLSSCPAGSKMDHKVLWCRRQPCLGHFHGDPGKPDEPNGHALTTSAHLFSLSDGLHSANARHPPTACPSFHKAPTAILERLLNLTPDLSNDGEITPIQAWNSIRSRPQFGGVDLRKLWALAEGLRDAVQCHGFGAVVKTQVFERLVHVKLVLGQSF